MLFKSEIVKSIIKFKLGLIDYEINAKECIIKEIDNKTCKSFLNHNHINGYTTSKFEFGLFHNNKIVSVMTFNEKNKNMFEVNRFCDKINTNVIGSTSKLFNYFIKKYNPKKIVTYLDNRYFNGYLFDKFNFKLIKETEPNYWYLKPNDYTLYEKKNLTISDLNKHSFLKIYDAGSKKYEFTT